MTLPARSPARDAATTAIAAIGNRFGYPGRAARLLILALLFAAIAKIAIAADVPSGIWLLESKVAIRIFDCSGQLCGQLVWLHHPRDAAGILLKDGKNPDPGLSPRTLCGQVVLWDLQPAGPDRWKDGWLYNPDDGKTYRVNGQFSSPDTFVARIYVGIPLFGRTSTWQRVPRLSSEGWC